MTIDSEILEELHALLAAALKPVAEVIKQHEAALARLCVGALSNSFVRRAFFVPRRRSRR